LTSGTGATTPSGASPPTGAGPPARPLRIFLGAFGDPGHAFPMLALGERLAARGHEVTLETWSRWREPVAAAGLRFVAAPEYPVFPTRDRPMKPYEAVLAATPVTRRELASARPDVVVHDVLTIAPALAGELEGASVATLVPHVLPVSEPGFPPYAVGARLPRTAAGRALWGALSRPLRRGLEQGRAELNETRRRLGLPPVARLHGGISPELCIVGTFPQLEYPRAWPSGTEVVGPLLWEPPAEEVELPPGEDPLVLVATSTAQDPEHRMLRAVLAGLAGEQVRVLGTWNRRRPTAPLPVPANARLVEWMSYERTMPRAALVVCHAGHGTLVRALSSGCPVLAVPHLGDMNENAARVDWAGAGVRVPWRFVSPATMRQAVRRALRDRALAVRARELADWAAVNDGASRAAELVEAFARRRHRRDSARTR
jgi:MGT family glycosyltransferase